MDIEKEIKELQEEGQKLLQQRERMATDINQINIRITEIRGAFKILQSLNKEKEKPKKK